MLSNRKYASSTPNEQFAVIPDDFRMLAGDINRDYFDPDEPSHQAISFQCIGDGYDCQSRPIEHVPRCAYISVANPQIACLTSPAISSATGSVPKHSFPTAGTALTRTVPTAPTSAIPWATTKVVLAPMALSAFLHSLWKVGLHERQPHGSGE